MIFKICALNCICLENSKLKKIKYLKKMKGREEGERKKGRMGERERYTK